MLRWRAETMPAVTVPPSPNGLPTAITQSPTRIASLSPNLTAFSGFVRLDLEHGDVDLGVGADQLGAQLLPVGEDHDDLVGVGDDVVVGDDDALWVDDEARAERVRLPLAVMWRVLAVPLLEEFVEEVVEGRALLQVGIAVARGASSARWSASPRC